MVALWAVFVPGLSSLSQRGRIRARGIAWGDVCSRKSRAYFELWVQVSKTRASERRGCMAEPARPRTWTKLLCRATSCDEEQFSHVSRAVPSLLGLYIAVDASGGCMYLVHLSDDRA